MNARRASAGFFAVEFRPAVWLPAIGLTLATVVLESFIHALRPVDTGSVPAVIGSLTAVLPPSVWELLYVATYSIYFLPLLIPSRRARRGTMRRLLVGFGFQLLIAGGLLLLSANQTLGVGLAVCLHVANAFFVFLVLCRGERSAVAGAVFGGFLLAAVATLSSRRHEWLAVGVALLTASAAYRVVFSAKLSFLDHAEPGSVIRHWLHNLSNLCVNRRLTWETAYAAGQWRFLESMDQRPRHYVIADCVSERFPRGADVLDVGCGYATLHRVLGPHARTYTGIDLAATVIEECRKVFKEDARCRFENVAFDDYQADGKFDVVVLNEVLYYFPIRSVRQVCQSARNLLKNEDSVLIVSMCGNSKARWVWRRMGELMRPAQNIRVSNLATGSYWIVKVYPRD